MRGLTDGQRFFIARCGDKCWALLMNILVFSSILSLVNSKITPVYEFFLKFLISCSMDFYNIRRHCRLPCLLEAHVL